MTGTEPVLTGDNRPSTYWEEGRLILRASALGKCLRDLVAHLTDMTPLPVPPQLMARYQAGHAWEPFVIERLKALEWEMQGMAQDEGELSVAGASVRFHPDEVCVPASIPEPHLLEIKSFAPSSYSTARSKGVGKVFAEYETQLSVMMHALKLPAVWVAINKGECPRCGKSTVVPVVGLERDCTSCDATWIVETPEELHMEFITTPPVTLGEITKKVLAIKKGWDQYEAGNDLPDCTTPDAFPCPFLYARPELEDVTPVLDGHEAELLEKWVDVYVQSRMDEKNATETKDTARTEILNLMRGREKVRVGAFRVNVGVQTRTRFDKKAAMAKYPDLGDFETTSESTVLRVEED